MGFLRKKLLEIFRLPTANLNLLPDRRHTGQLMHDYYQKLTQQLVTEMLSCLEHKAFIYERLSPSPVTSLVLLSWIEAITFF